LSAAVVAQLTQSESKPLGAVGIECHYPVVTLALKEILKEEAAVYEGGKRPPGTEHPSCVVLCPNGKDVASEVRRLRASNAGTPVLLFDMHVDSRLVRRALLAGASGFLYAGMHPEQIVRAVRLASEGRTAVPVGLLKSDKPAEEEPVGEEPAVADIAILTPRQRQIVDLVCEGLSNAQIAQHLFLTESTVKQHLRAAYKRLKVRNRIQAARLLRLA
jgi:DNA-binding NarL/FixJ family response regulator